MGAKLLSELCLSPIEFACAKCGWYNQTFIVVRLFEKQDIKCASCGHIDFCTMLPDIEDHPMTELKRYQCKKIVHAQPMSAEEFYTMSKRAMPHGTSHGDQGYHVVYDKGTDDEYHSWSPVAPFERGYDEIDESLNQTMGHFYKDEFLVDNEAKN